MTAVSTTPNQAAASVPSGSDVRDSGLLGFYHPYSTTTLTDNYTTTTTTTSHERCVPAATTTLVDAAAAELNPPLHTKPTVATTTAAADADLSHDFVGLHLHDYRAQPLTSRSRGIYPYLPWRQMQRIFGLELPLLPIF